MKSDEINKTIKDLKEAGENAKKKMIAFYLGLSKEKLIAEMRELDDSTLLWICEGMAMETEAYEICGAAQVVKGERGLE